METKLETTQILKEGDKVEDKKYKLRGTVLMVFKTSARVLWEFAPVRENIDGRLTVVRHDLLNLPNESLERIDGLTVLVQCIKENNN